MSTIDEKLVKVGEFEWFYRESLPNAPIDRTPILFLHGLPSRSYTWSGMLADYASAGLRTIAPDWLGFGQSEMPEKYRFNYSSDAYVDALVEFLDVLEIDRVSLVVQGFLGNVGLQFALRHRDRVDRIAILNAPILPGSKLPFKMQQMTWPLVGDMLTQDPLAIDRLLEDGSGFTIPDEDLDVYRRPWLRTSSAGRSLMYALRGLRLTDAIGEITAGFAGWSLPVLVVWGMNDPWLGSEGLSEFVTGLKDANLVELPEAGHFPQEHWTQEINESLLPFFRRSDL